MSMNRPRMPWPYAERADDCISALERDFLREVVLVGTPFIDMDSILAALADDASKAGWSEEEVTAAVIELTRRHRLANS